MLYIPRPTFDKVEDFYDSLIARVLAAKSASNLAQTAKDFLTKEKIKEIICDEPSKLLKHHFDLLPKLDPLFGARYYNQYTKIKKMQAGNRTQAQIQQYNHCNLILKELKAVFNYDKFFSGHKITSYKLSNLLSRNTCTYCNRLYTSHVVYKDEETGRVNKGSRVTRPFFDHWFSKSKYPVLALSFFNLIPSCSVCNSSVKSDMEFTLASHIHPYCFEPGQDFSFDFASQSVHENNILINAVSGSKIDKTLRDFKVREIYNAHSEHELKDLLELRYKYSDNYIETLFSKTFKVSIKKEEVYRLVFGVEYDENDHHKRPFSKFKRDILGKLGISILGKKP